MAGDLTRVYELRLGSRSLFVSVADQRASVVSRPSTEQQSDLVLTATPETVGGILIGAIGVDQALHGGLLTSRNRAEARHFFAMFAGLTERASRP